MRKNIPYWVRNRGRSFNSIPADPDEIKKPDIVQPIAFLINSSSQNSNSLLIDDVKGMLFSRTGLFIIGIDNFPFFEFYVKVLTSFSQNIDERKGIIQSSILIFTTKTENTLVFEVISQVSLKFICINNFVVGNFFMVLRIVVNWKNERIQYISSCESDKVQIFTEFIFFIDSSTHHQRTSEESWCMVFEANSSSCS